MSKKRRKNRADDDFFTVSVESGGKTIKSFPAQTPKCVYYLGMSCPIIGQT
jgi:hypothetical protein